MRHACLAAAILCACERTPSRLERLAEVKTQALEDEDLARGEAALASLRPRALPMPGSPAMDAYVDLTLDLRVPAMTGPELERILGTRLELLRRTAATAELGDGRLKLVIAGVLAAHADTTVLALTLGGRMSVAHVPRGTETITPGDPQYTWWPLPVARAYSQLSEIGLTEELALEFTPEGAATLLDLTSREQSLAVTVDDRTLTVASVTAPLTEGKLRGPFTDSGLPVAALVAALASPLPTPLVIEDRKVRTYTDRGCTDPVTCEAGCREHRAPACLGLLATDARPSLDLVQHACTLGVGLGCTRMCEQDPRAEACREAADLLLTPGLADLAGLEGLLARGCQRGDFDACAMAEYFMATSTERTSDFVTVDHTLMQIRDEAAIIQATARRKHLVETAARMCEDSPFPDENRAQACLFAAKAHRVGLLVPSQAERERTLLRRAGEFLARGHRAP